MASGSEVVLVVEDDPLLLQVIRDLLAMYGLQTVGATTSEQAHALATTARPVVCLIDLMLSESSGLELASQLRASGLAETPMIAMSVSDEMLGAAERSGLFQQVLWKPFQVTELIACINESLTEPEDRD